MYKTKRKIDGYKVLGRMGAGKKLIGIPTKYLTGDPVKVEVISEETVYTITGEPLKTEVFQDKFGRGEYKIAYFEV